MIYLILLACVLISFVFLERYLLGYEQKKQQNMADKEYYEQMRRYSEAMEKEIAELKVYRHDLARYIRFLEKLSFQTDNEAVGEYLDLLRRKNRMVQDIEQEVSESREKDIKEIVSARPEMPGTESV